MTKKGYSLVELIVVIAVFSVAIPMLIYMLLSLTTSSLNAEKRTTAAFLCQQKMEQVIADRMNPNKGFGALAIGTSSEGIPGFPAFSRLTRVVYVTKSGSAFVESPTPTYYKKVTVTVSNPQISDTRLDTIIGIR